MSNSLSDNIRLINNKSFAPPPTAYLVLGLFKLIALAIVLANKPNIIIFAKQGSPMVIGKGLNSNFIASDYYGIACHTNQIMMLEDGDFGYISAQEVIVYNKQNELASRKCQTFAKINDSLHKNGFDHFMLKEIYEQPIVLQETIETYLDISNYNFNCLIQRCKVRS